MWIELSTTSRCGACGDEQRVSRVVDDIPCATCGAVLSLLPELWAAALGSAVRQVAHGDEGDSFEVALTSKGGGLSLRYRRAAPSCRGCGASWEAGPPGGSCGSCGEAVVGRPPPWGADELVLQLVGEGAEAAPTWLWCDEQLATPPLAGEVGLSRLCPGPGGRIYGIGSLEWEPVLMALDTAPLELRWKQALPHTGQPEYLALVGEELWLADLQSPQVKRFAAATGASLGSFEVAQTNGVQTMVAMADGTVILHCYPSNRLERVDAEGQLQPLWAPSGFITRLLGWDRGGFAQAKPISRPGVLSQGRVGPAPGGLCTMTTLGGVIVGLLDGGGKLLWTRALPELSMLTTSAVTACDGNTWAWGGSQHGSALVRIPPGGAEHAVVRQTSHEELGRLSALGDPMAVGPDGDVWLAGQGIIERYDASGRLRWFWHAEG